MPGARALMIQGTASHSGKSLIVAGLCRIFHQEGLRVVPFKSQNMALNSYVTLDGCEMGWAQAMQAEAAGVEPRVEMNPILLKPQSDRQSQVVLLGKVIGTSTADGYYKTTRRLWGAVTDSYQQLAAEADLVLIEGAGNPAEPNLMDREIANMAVARLVGAPVLLVGDIDRGGVFGSLIGTMSILNPGDRRRIKGFIINKFRGDLSLLDSAMEFLERRARRPVLGVVPWLRDLHLPEEDSVALEEPAPGSVKAVHPGQAQRHGVVTIAVVLTPHIANFTDFGPLELEPGLNLVYARRPRDLADARLVILPGSKDTIADLRSLKAQGFGEAIFAHFARGGSVGGICGGFQMLGRSVSDPQDVEAGGVEPGFGLLPVTTVLEPRKITRRVRARLLPGPWGGESAEWEAYEIHVGTTSGGEALPPLFSIRCRGRRPGGGRDGVITADGRVWGTYLHGCFDAPEIRRRLLSWLGAGPFGAWQPSTTNYRAVREAAYDALAESLRSALNLSAIRALVGV